VPYACPIYVSGSSVANLKIDLYASQPVESPTTTPTTTVSEPGKMLLVGITVHHGRDETVCKGDRPRQWKTAIFRLTGKENP